MRRRDGGPTGGSHFLGGSIVQRTSRRRLFVDQQIQGTLLYRIGIYWCFAVLTVCLVTLCFRAITYGGPSDSFWDYFAFREFFTQYGLVVLASLVLVPVIMFDVLVTTNRFSGPLYRVRRSLRALAEGEKVAPIQFRENDFLKDLADEFNAVVQRVEELENELAEAKRKAGDTQDLEAAANR